MVVMFFFISVVSILLAVPACRKAEEKIIYPQTRKVDQVDDYFGTKVADPYRWLEDDNSEETKNGWKNRTKVTFAYLEKIPYREKIAQRLKDIYNYPTPGTACQGRTNITFL